MQKQKDFKTLAERNYVFGQITKEYDSFNKRGFYLTLYLCNEKK